MVVVIMVVMGVVIMFYYFTQLFNIPNKGGWSEVRKQYCYSVILYQQILYN